MFKRYRLIVDFEVEIIESITLEDKEMEKVVNALLQILLEHPRFLTDFNLHYFISDFKDYPRSEHLEYTFKKFSGKQIDIELVKEVIESLPDDFEFKQKILELSYAEDEEKKGQFYKIMEEINKQLGEFVIKQFTFSEIPKNVFNFVPLLNPEAFGLSFACILVANHEKFRHYVLTCYAKEELKLQIHCPNITAAANYFNNFYRTIINNKKVIPVWSNCAFSTCGQAISGPELCQEIATQ